MSLYRYIHESDIIVPYIMEVVNTSMDENRSKETTHSADSLLVLAGMLYVCLPVMVFALGWLRLYYAIPVTAVLILFVYGSWKQLSGAVPAKSLFCSNTLTFWIVTASVVLLWVYLSGIGGLVWQNGDHVGRNPMFRDLCTQKWPLIIDLSKENDAVQRVCGSGKVGYTYYFSWWLPVASVAKILSLGETSRNILLYFYAAAGVFLTVYFICRKFNKCSYWIPLVFVFFSGADAIPSFLIYEPDITQHIEWWSGLFQYSSNTTQLFWVFNQTIPVWLIVILMLQNDKNKYFLAVAALTFAYSPWAAMGIIPMALVMCYRQYRIKDLINVFNIIVPLILIVFMGSFYLSGNNGEEGSIWSCFGYYPIDARRILLTYFVFILFEIGLYFIAMGRYAVKYELYYTILAELLIIPFIVVRDYNFTMRASIPALFALMLFVMRFFIERAEKGKDNKDYRVRFAILLVAFILSSITPLHEINRVVRSTMTEEELLREDCYSYANIKLEDEGYINLIKEQYFVYDYEDVFFYKYFAAI